MEKNQKNNLIPEARPEFEGYKMLACWQLNRRKLG